MVKRQQRGIRRAKQLAKEEKGTRTRARLRCCGNGKFVCFCLSSSAVCLSVRVGICLLYIPCLVSLLLSLLLPLSVRPSVCLSCLYICLSAYLSVGLCMSSYRSLPPSLPLSPACLSGSQSASVSVCSHSHYVCLCYHSVYLRVCLFVCPTSLSLPFTGLHSRRSHRSTDRSIHQPTDQSTDQPVYLRISRNFYRLAVLLTNQPTGLTTDRPIYNFLTQPTNRVFAIYQIVLGWKTCKYYYETDELPNPRPTQHKKNEVKSGIWPTFSHRKIFFRGSGLILYRKQTTRNPTQPNSPQTP